jgi:hypothetical protein
LVLREAKKPLMTCLIKNNWKIVSHYVLITHGGPGGDLIERDLAFGVLLAVIFPKLLKLKIPWPDDLSEMRSKLFETRGAMFGVVLDTTHVLMGLAIISTTIDVTVGVARRKTVTEIARRVLVDLLISIAMTIMVVVTMTSTTFLSALITAATTAISVVTIATTTREIGCSMIIVMLATWML